MIDPKFVEAHPHVVEQMLRDRRSAEHEIGLASEATWRLVRRRELETERQNLNAETKAISKRVHEAIKAGDELAVAAWKDKAAVNAHDLDVIAARLKGLDPRPLLLSIPNIPDPAVPVGDETANEIVAHGKTPVPEFAFQPRDHVDIGVGMGCLDFEQTAKISGARFATLSGALARLERALGSMMLDTHLGRGWREVSPPTVVDHDALVGTGQFPKFYDDIFEAKATNYSGRYLIPTAEVSLTNLVRERIVPVEELPIRMVALTPCYRAEAGSAGRDTRGLIRQHQFQKVELVSITTPETALAEHAFMVECAEAVLDELDLPFRRVLLSTGDMGFTSHMTFDLEVWLPSQNTYREISSISWCGDFQARRMDARYRVGKDKPRFVHTLNGSGVAVGRAIVAVLENFQNEDGSVRVPQALQTYMGARLIRADGSLDW